MVSGILFSVIYADVPPSAFVLYRACSSVGMLSMRYIRMNPEMSASPVHVCGDKSWSALCELCCFLRLTLYSVLTPSGMMTMRDVPTRMPMPNADRSRM